MFADAEDLAVSEAFRRETVAPLRRSGRPRAQMSARS
jgi:hypothetical protein